MMSTDGESRHCPYRCALKGGQKALSLDTVTSLRDCMTAKYKLHMYKHILVGGSDETLKVSLCTSEGDKLQYDILGYLVP